MLELAGRTRPALREAAMFVLGLSVFSCLLALTLGYLLAYGSGDAGAGVSRHMWSGMALTIAVSLCALLRGSSAGFRRFYPYLLVCVLLLLAWTAHQGGSLTHGDKYLSEYMPAPLKRLAGGRLPAKPPDFPIRSMPVVSIQSWMLSAWSAMESRRSRVGSGLTPTTC